MTCPLDDLDTPALLLDSARMQRNIDRMQARMDTLGVAFRPHVKTSKCVEVAARQRTAGARGITVSTLKEADRFLAAGFADILYAVAIAPAKFDHALALARKGAALTLLVDSARTAALLSQHGMVHGHCHRVLIEIDTDGHRSGLDPDDPALALVASALCTRDGVGARLVGVLTHAGSSYGLNSAAALQALAERERAGCVNAARRLRAAGYPCEVVSVGSTPTALSAARLDDVTEVRAGVYVFFDLVMAGVGVCDAQEIALSVLCSVIGHQPSRGRVIVDAGWMAMSRDRGTASQRIDHGYGQVCDIGARPIPELRFPEANQEHGILHWSGPPGEVVEAFPIGTRLRILPNHACATGAQFCAYRVLPDPGGTGEIWERFNGW